MLIPSNMRILHKIKIMKHLLCLLAGLFILQMGFRQELTGVVNINGKPADKLF